MKTIAIAVMLVSMVCTASAQKKRTATHCTVEGGKGSVRCGGTSGAMACVELHEDLCQSDDVLPNCCAASPLSNDRTARDCGCCGSHRITAKITIPYDEID